VRILKKQKMDLELRLKDQEEELDDLAGQVNGCARAHFCGAKILILLFSKFSIRFGCV
jgi:hypothetical protein